ncbi:MAG: thiamine-phosphate kinase [candidate division WOR-3 bacterium]
MRINQLGEQGLIRIIQRQVHSRGNLQLGIGDDALILKDGSTVLTTDTYAEGVHFDLSYMSYYDVGTRCACAALSDVVAMGGEPKVLLVGLAVPQETDLRAIRQLYQGLERICKEMGCEIGGGDIIALDRLVIALTALGRAAVPVLRSGAQPGDYLYLTGYTGLAETGRLILAGRARLPAYTAGIRLAVQRHLCPVPRLQVMRALRLRMSALIDTSDGLGTDARQLSTQSRVKIVIEPDWLPIHPVTLQLCQEQRRSPLEFALSAGEDYELLFTCRSSPPSIVKGVKITRIGRVEKGRGFYIKKGENKIVPLKITGYDHLVV